MGTVSTSQFELTVDTNDFDAVVEDQADLRHIHHTKGLSFYEILYKYNLKKSRLRNEFDRYHISRNEPHRWQNAEAALEKVADNNDEQLFASLLNNPITVNDVKAVIEGHGFAEYDESFEDIRYKMKNELYDALATSETLSDAAQKLNMNGHQNMTHWTRIYFDKTPAQLLAEGDIEPVDEDDDESTEGSETVELGELSGVIDMSALAERVETDTTIDVVDGDLVATISAESDGVVSFEVEETVEILSTE